MELSFSECTVKKKNIEAWSKVTNALQHYVCFYIVLTHQNKVIQESSNFISQFQVDYLRQQFFSIFMPKSLHVWLY